MTKRVNLAWLGLAMMAATAAAQTGTVPLDNGTAPSGMTNSNITEVGGNVGIGTANPWIQLEVDSPASKSSSSNVNVFAASSSYTADGSNQLQLVTQMIPSATATSRAMGLQAVEQGVAYRSLALQYNGGNVGIGTTSPQNTLEVNGTAQVDGALVGPNNGAVTFGGSGISFANGGGTQTTAWTGVLCGGDYAEDMRAEKKKETYEPGDVLVLTSDDNSDIQKSIEPYSTMVAGIYATKPGVVGLRDAVSKSPDNVPMAMVGVVPTKVTAENGPIRKGDLLVTSSLKGYAMKGSDRSKMLGAVLGKAMGTLNSGTGVIEVLVTLQ